MASQFGCLFDIFLLVCCFMCTASGNAYLESLGAIDELPVDIQVNITTVEDLTFTYCCQDNSIMAGTTSLDPMDDTPLDAARVRIGSNIKVKVMKSNPNVTVDLDKVLFTILMVDPDVPQQYAFVGTRELPIAHWLVINLKASPDGVLVNGTEVLSYRGPRPPKGLDPIVHNYYFLLYAHTYVLSDVDPNDYTGDCVEQIEGRCLFNVTTFSITNDLTLSGASSMRVQNNDYVQFIGQTNQTEDCKGRPGYQDPCETPTSGSSSVFLVTGPLFMVVMVIISQLVGDFNWRKP